MGTKTGYRLFSVTAVDKLDCIHEGGNKEPFTNMHLPSLHAQCQPPLPEAVVRCALLRLLFSCVQIAESAFSSPIVWFESESMY